MVLSPLLRTSLALVLIVGTGVAKAEDRFGCERPIRLAYSGDLTLQRQGKGIDPDLIAELSQRSACRFEVIALPPTDIWVAMHDGRVDMFTGGMMTGPRKGDAFFVPYLYLRNKLVVPLELGLGLQTFEDFQRIPGARIGVVAGRSQGPYLDSMLHIMRGEGRVIEFPTDSQAGAALLEGEVQGLIGHELSLAAEIGRDALRRRFRVVNVVPGPASARMLVLSRRHFTAAQSAEWARLIEAMRLDGTLVRILLRNAPLDTAAKMLDSGYRSAPAQGARP